MELANEQDTALRSILTWHEEAQTKPSQTPGHFVLCGYAGTGKTTLLNFLLREIRGATVATMTGKAMSVVKAKLDDDTGAKCRTIHNLLYKPTSFKEQKLVDRRAELKAMLAGEERKTYIDDMLREIHTMDQELDGLSFMLREDADDEGGLIVVDEASMISQHVYNDLMQLGRPVLFVGDDMQLPPVQGKSIFAELGVDARLTEVHRQALDNPILALATAIREGDADRVNTWKRYRFDAAMAARADKVLCYTNKTRHNINRVLRDVHGYHGIAPLKGDKLICTYNVPGYSMINGGEAVATSDFRTERLGAHTIATGGIDYEGKPKECMFSLENFSAHYLDPRKCKQDRDQMDEYTIPKMDSDYKDVRWFDYGYAVTVHKAQGSEYDKVFLYDDAEWLGKRPGGMKQRQQWLYTAVTRAKNKLAWVR